MIICEISGVVVVSRGSGGAYALRAVGRVVVVVAHLRVHDRLLDAVEDRHRLVLKRHVPVLRHVRVDDDCGGDLCKCVTHLPPAQRINMEWRRCSLHRLVRRSTHCKDPLGLHLLSLACLGLLRLALACMCLSWLALA